MVYIKNKTFWVLCIISLMVTCCHLTTVKNYPLCWFDEVEIQELGRYSTYDQYPTWSMDLNSKTRPYSNPKPTFHYFGGWIQESLYRIFDSYIAPRIFCIFGLMFATILFYVWLIKKKVDPCLALIGSLLFISDTNVTVGVHWYRLDIWVIGITFISCILVLCSNTYKESSQFKIFFLVGVLMVFQVFFWITSITLWPLILAEILQLSINENWTFKKYRNVFCSIFLGSLFSLSILLLPLYQELFTVIINFLSSLLEQFQNGESSIERDFFLDLKHRIILFLSLIIRTPFIWIGGILGLFFFKKNKYHIFAFLISLFIVLFSHLYHARVNYLTPLIFLFFLETVSYSIKHRVLKKVIILFLIFALIYSFGLSVIGMNYLARPITKENSYEALLSKAEPLIEKEKNVYTFTYDIYHVARKLKWNLYSLSQADKFFNIEVSKPLLEKLDYIIIGDDYPLTDEQNRFLISNSFVRSKGIEMPKDQLTGITAKFRPIIYARGYPSFTIWERKNIEQ